MGHGSASSHAKETSEMQATAATWDLPCCGTISMSPSALPMQQSTMEALAV